MPIFDQGYQHWSGTLSGHTWRWMTIARQGVRVGMKLNFKNILLWIVIILSWLPAAMLAFVLCVWGLFEQKSPLLSSLMPFLTELLPPEVVANPRQYRVEVWTLCYYYFLRIEVYISMAVVLLIGPGLISQDLRLNALPLYFSRPVRRIDYFLGKLGVIAWFLCLVLVFPSLIAYGLGLLFSLDITIVWDTFPLLLACLAYGAIIVLSAGTLILALSSLSRNSRYIALFWLALLFVTMTVGGILNAVDTQQRRFNMFRKQSALMTPVQPPGDRPLNPDEHRALQMAQQRAWQEAYMKARQEFEAEELQASQTNWRWLVSYTANLDRIGQLLLNTDGAWRKWSLFVRPERRNGFLVNNLGPQYPWYWSAGVLAVLFGLSVCLLNLRVRSLDRLK